MTYKLFIDDERFPKDEDFIITRSFKETIEYLKKNWCPVFITFDHDLGLNKDWKELNWYDIVKWIVEKDLKSNWKFIPTNFSFSVHSMNPVGRKNIEDYFNNYLKFKKEK